MLMSSFVSVLTALFATCLIFVADLMGLLGREINAVIMIASIFS
jgi:hypothetical protein